MSPKTQFLENKAAAEAHSALVSKHDVREALLVAFNEYCWRLPSPDHPQQSWAANAKREGAKEFIETFLSLGLPTVTRKPTTSGILEDENGPTNRTGRNPSK